MQVLKDEIKKLIIDSAKKEFLIKGYEMASLREIAKASGVTVGNLYHYFKSKDEIFTVIVKPAVKEFIFLLKDHQKEYPEIHEKFIVSKLFSNIEPYIDVLSDKVILHKDSLLILLNCSKGTKYESAKEDTVFFVAEHFMEHFRNFFPEDKIKEYFILARSIARAFVEGYLELLKFMESKEKVKEYTREFFRVVINGFREYI